MRKFLKRLLLGGLLVAVVAGAVVATVLLTGDEDEGRDTISSLGSSVEIRPDGSLTEPPDLLEPSDLDEFATSTPERTVMEFLYFGQWGNLPSIVETYTEEVVVGLGVSPITGTYSYLRPQLAVSLPRIAGVERLGEDEAFVTAEFYSEAAPPTFESFFLKRAGDDWEVGFDTLLERGLLAYTHDLNAADPATSDRDALRKAEEVAQDYRDIETVPPG